MAALKKKLLRAKSFKDHFYAKLRNVFIGVQWCLVHLRDVYIIKSYWCQLYYSGVNNWTSSCGNQIKILVIMGNDHGIPKGRGFKSQRGSCGLPTFAISIFFTYFKTFRETDIQLCWIKSSIHEPFRHQASNSWEGKLMNFTKKTAAGSC